MDKNHHILEWAPFTIKEGITEQELLQASKALQTDFLEKQSGFIRRELLVQSDRNYIDMVLWENMEAAHGVMEKVKDSAACSTYFALMEEADTSQPEQGVSHYQTYAQY
ncbi:hypothetical protein [Flagellimonas myxillae]|uniref:hypothetical protein n=1 Tax=Flagellimonas myxillae TaxID=2942214 RepID=UPI00201EE553|nr:hypothetical protein [Muricauda myxillae]MCL6265578.1 hypothetical protein [Muricauda myxillae]